MKEPPERYLLLAAVLLTAAAALFFSLWSSPAAPPSHPGALSAEKVPDLPSLHLIFRRSMV